MNANNSATFLVVALFTSFLLFSCQNDSARVKLNKSELTQLDKNIGNKFELNDILDTSGNVQGFVSVPELEFLNLKT